MVWEDNGKNSGKRLIYRKTGLNSGYRKITTVFMKGTACEINLTWR